MKANHFISLAIVFVLSINVIQVNAGNIVPADQTSAIRTTVQPFDLSQVTLLDGICKDRQIADGKYLLSLDPDSLLYNFRKNAGLPSPGKTLGGWEAPSCELRGHFVGHYLSACALMYRTTGDIRFKNRGDLMVTELAKCQKALGDGYLSAFPVSFMERVEANQYVWAPYYTIHKIVAGMVDMYQYAGNKEALNVALSMADYFRRRSDKLSDDQFNNMMHNEFGGMANVLYDLYNIAHRPDDLKFAHRFDQASFFDPLSNHIDNLRGIHANTHLPKVLGMARRYELLNDPKAKDITTFFWDTLVNHHSYATCGSNSGEYWGEADKLAYTLTTNNQETCTSYNVLKLTRDLFRWTAAPKYADLYEKLYYNGIIMAQNPENGMMIYYLPLQSGKAKNWGDSTESFWCCYGTGVESFAKLNDSIYFHNQNGIYVNLYVPSVLNWKDKGIRLTQNTTFPESNKSSFTITASKPVRLALHFHIPEWTDSAYIVVNGKKVQADAKKSSYAMIERVWKSGDKVDIHLPMHLYTVSMPDDKNISALLYGPLTLAGVTDEPLIPLPKNNKVSYIKIRNGNLTDWVKPVSGNPLTFQSYDTDKKVVFIPLYKVIRQQYSVYWGISTPGSALENDIKQAEWEEKTLKERTIDFVIPNNENSEKEHNLKYKDSSAGDHWGGSCRDASGYFQWDLKVLPNTKTVLRCTYWGGDNGRNFDIFVNDIQIATESLTAKNPDNWLHVDYDIPDALIGANSKITVKFVPHSGSIAGGVFGCAILKK